MPIPAGTKLSLHNGQLLVSTGIPTLDDVLGGGLPVGSVLLVEQDQANAYSQLVLRYFASQGAASLHQHTVVVSDTPLSWSSMLMGWRDLPAEALIQEISNGPQMEEEKAQAGDELKIAWRYAKQSRVYGASDGSHLKQNATSLNSGTKSSSSFKPSITKKYEPMAQPAGPLPKSPSSGSTPSEYCHVFDMQSRLNVSYIQEHLDSRLHAISIPDTDDNDWMLSLEQLIQSHFTFVSSPVLNMSLLFF